MAVYECIGGTVALSGSQAICTGGTWSTSTAQVELSGELITTEQAHDLAQALILLFVTIAVYRALARAF